MTYLSLNTFVWSLGRMGRPFLWCWELNPLNQYHLQERRPGSFLFLTSFSKSVREGKSCASQITSLRGVPGQSGLNLASERSWSPPALPLGHPQDCWGDFVQLRPQKENRSSLVGEGLLMQDQNDFTLLFSPYYHLNSENMIGNQINPLHRGCCHWWSLNEPTL